MAIRSRLQIELAAHHQRLLHDLGEHMGSPCDAETTRHFLDMLENIVDRIRQGYSSLLCRSRINIPTPSWKSRALCVPI
jgi:hypothetical protein